MGKLYSGAVAKPPRRRRIRVEVAPDKRAGDWKVTADGEVKFRFGTQRDAIKAAARWAISEMEAGELLTLKIKRPNGKIRDERTYGLDPRRSRG